MSEIILAHEQSYSTICAEITDLSGKLKLSTSSQELDTLSAKLEVLFSDAKETLEQVELECHSLEKKSKEKVGIRLLSYRAELGRQQQQFTACKTEASHRTDRLELFTRSEDCDTDLYMEMETETDDMLASSSRQLEDGRRLLAETEDIGTAVLGDLHGQRETIQRSRSRLKDVEGGLGASNTILKGMMLRAQQNKIVLAAVCLAVALVLVWGVYHLAT
eukprot:TRINITY_DN22208_c0_g1_i1.p1 TRINITY_DN22208_c0_g1~~TRINITY_DN22208_c0_g1_i1.p1  ORF type:complete len:219 (-),score=97.50 TRINITY_DN22208_c0_g1_i1:117-773(-)